MGKITKEIDIALKNTTHLLGNISNERIREEFIKGLLSSKSTKKYLYLLDKYNLFDWILKGMIINNKFVDNDDPLVLIAILLSANDNSILQKKLNELKYTSDEIKKITTLVSVLNLNTNTSETAPKLKNLFIQSKLSNDQLINFWSNMRNDLQLLKSFERYIKLPKITGGEAMKKYNITKPGPNLGKAIQRMEVELFESLI